MDSDKKVVVKTKTRRRNLERRKEKSRDAARCRREKETEIFTNLSVLLPVPMGEAAHLDKASIMRIAISYLKMRNVLMPKNVVPERAAEMLEKEGCFLEALEGFLLLTSANGDIVYVSDNVGRFLGLSQVDMLGQSIYELSHPCDHDEIKEMLSLKASPDQKSVLLRMKCTLTGKGRNLNLKSSSYKVIQFTGHMCLGEAGNSDVESWSSSSSSQRGESSDEGKSIESSVGCSSRGSSVGHFIAIGEPISHPANIEVPLGLQTFLSKHYLDMKFSYADEKIVDFFGYDPKCLLKRSVFDFYHAEDIASIRNSYKHLFQKGQMQTDHYRFLAHGGGFVWVMTQATLIYNNKLDKPESVVCVNYVISGVEFEKEVYAVCQLEGGVTAGTQRGENLNVVTKTTTTTSEREEVIKEEFSAAAACKPNIKLPTSRPISLSPSSSPASFYHVQVPTSDQPISIAPSNKLAKAASKRNSAKGRASAAAAAAAAANHPKATLPKSDQLETQAHYQWNLPFPEVDNQEGSKEQREKQQEENSKPKLATVNVFVPFTEDMKKGFLTFTEDDTHATVISLKEDPDDLTHLAPTAGDVCLPLDEEDACIVYELSTEDILENIMLSDCNFNQEEPNQQQMAPQQPQHLLQQNLVNNQKQLQHQHHQQKQLSSNEDASFYSFNDSDSSPIVHRDQEDLLFGSGSSNSSVTDDSMCSLRDGTINHFLDFTLMPSEEGVSEDLLLSANGLSLTSGKQSPSFPPGLENVNDPLLDSFLSDQGFIWSGNEWSGGLVSSPSRSLALDDCTSLAKLLQSPPMFADSSVCTNKVIGCGNGNGYTSLSGLSDRTYGLIAAQRNYNNVNGDKAGGGIFNGSGNGNGNGSENGVTYHKSNAAAAGLAELLKRRALEKKEDKSGAAKRNSSIAGCSWSSGSLGVKRSKMSQHADKGGGGAVCIKGRQTNEQTRMETSHLLVKQQQQQKQHTDSVLMNLLISGRDVSTGYDSGGSNSSFYFDGMGECDGNGCKGDMMENFGSVATAAAVVGNEEFTLETCQDILSALGNYDPSCDWIE